jgi:hypothetical protein
VEINRKDNLRLLKAKTIWKQTYLILTVTQALAFLIQTYNDEDLSMTDLEPEIFKLIPHKNLKRDLSPIKLTAFDFTSLKV